MAKLSKEIVALIRDPRSIKVIATSDDNGIPHSAFKNCLTVLEDGNLAFAEVFEGSRTNANLVRSVWFDKDVDVLVRGEDGTTWRIAARAYKYSYTGPLFQKFYDAARQKRGPDSELGGVWIVTPLEVTNETYSVRKIEEDERHPFYRHLDRVAG